MATKDKLVNLEDLKAVYDHGTELLEEKADQIGSYPDLIAGTADNLLSSSYQTDRTPYIIRRAKGAREKGSIVGGSIVWNQRTQNGNFESTTGWVGRLSTLSASGNVLTLTPSSDGTSRGFYSNRGANDPLISVGHKYLLSTEVLSPIASGISLTFQGAAGAASTPQAVANQWTPCATIWTTNNATMRENYYTLVQANLTTSQEVKFRNHMSHDITLMFGPTIADYIYAQEQATAGAGVALAKALAGITANYYPYDAGTIKSVTGLTAHRMTGFNQFDDSILGTYGWSHESDGSWSCTSGDAYYTKVLWENTFGYTGQVCFTMTYKYGTNSLGMKPRFVYTDGTYDTFNPTTSTTYNTVTYVSNVNKTIAYIITTYGVAGVVTYWKDVCINFSDPSKNGTYEPYTAHTYPLDSSLTLRGLPKLDGDSIYYDGDIYKADGTVERKYGIVDLGTLNWGLYSTPANHVFRAIRTNLPSGSALEPADHTTPANVICPMYTVMGYGPITANNHGRMAIGDSRIVIIDHNYSDAADFKAAMSGVMLVYELATPTTEQAEPYTALQVCDPAGTEEFVGASMPVGHDTKYYEDLKGKLEDVPDAPSADGTYTLKVTVSNGVATYSWG